MRRLIFGIPVLVAVTNCSDGGATSPGGPPSDNPNAAATSGVTPNAPSGQSAGVSPDLTGPTQSGEPGGCGNADAAPCSDEAQDEPVIRVEQPGLPDAGLSNECARDTYTTERQGVNLMLLLDVSGSMLTPINSDGDTQWEAVSAALGDFITSSTADGLSIALNYFPAMEPRYSCESGEICSDGYACVSQVCDLRLALLGIPQPCNTSDDCLTFVFEDGSEVVESCVEPYGCAGRATELCISDTCQKDVACEVSGPTVGFCPGITSCEIADYESASVDLTTLPEGRTALLDSIDSVIIDIGAQTPTHLGLRGATSQIREWINGEPEKKSVLVLATDGLPTSCETPLQTAGELTTTELDVALTYDIQTFVIGVVPGLVGDPELDAEINTQRDIIDGYAASGGTGAATFVSADDSTAQAFLEALDSIRRSVLPCEFSLPDEEIRFDQVNVEVTQNDEATIIPKVDGPAACTTEPGWYYDADTEGAASGEPEAAVLCPLTCQTINEGLSTRVDIILGCPTLTPQVR